MDYNKFTKADVIKANEILRAELDVARKELTETKAIGIRASQEAREHLAGLAQANRRIDQFLKILMSLSEVS